MYCKDYKHWDKDFTDYREELGELGICKNVPMLENALEWNEDYTGQSVKPKHRDKRAFAIDGSAYHAALATLDSFGCIQFKGRNQDEEVSST